jgi:hypothetical protein
MPNPEAVWAEIAATGAESAGLLALSVFEGTAHVVTDRPLPDPPPATMRISVPPGAVPIAAIDDPQCEIMYWLATQIDQLTAKVTADRFADGAASSPLLRAEEQVLEAILTGAPLHGTAWLAARRRTLAEGAFVKFAIVRSLGDAEGAMEDVGGQLEAGDVHSAVLSARKAFNHTVDALLEHHGVLGTYDHHRRARRFRAAAPSALSFERFWAIETMAGLDPDRSADWATEVLRVCEDITATLPADLVAQSVRGPRRGW